MQAYDNDNDNDVDAGDFDDAGMLEGPDASGASRAALARTYVGLDSWSPV
jgi:hypothetical protein